MAFIDARMLEGVTRIEADLCIVGSGAAGLALASRFFDRRHRVVLLESGGATFEPEIQSLYQGRVVGQPHAALDTCRLRFFGGTTNHWTAHVHPLEPIDFEERPWVVNSGWPFARGELDPYYEAAGNLLAVPPGAFELAPSAPDAAGRRLPGTDLETHFRYVLPPADRRLGPLLHEPVSRSKNVDTYLHANVLRLELDGDGRRVEQLRVGTLSGRRFTATARRYVLATGGIENARILLLSSIDRPASGAPLPIGRFFANHPEAFAGYASSSALAPLQAPRRFGRGTRKAFLRLSADLQQQHHLHNCWIEPRGHVGAERATTLLDAQSRKRSRRVDPGLRDDDVARLAAGMDLPAGRARPTAGKGGFVGIHVFAEPTPNPNSQVRLDTERDGFGQPRALLDWQIARADAESARRSLELFAREIAAAGKGRARLLFPDDGFDSMKTSLSHHHMGTTRMHEDPRLGVVDAQCRVHGIANLFVAGSSVFPTYGTVNPTYTILALAFRLAQQLESELG